jgi:hypothetical protein
MNDARRATEIALCTLLLVLGLWLLAIRPAQRDAERLDAELATARAATAQAGADLERLREAERDAPANRRALRRLAVALPAKGGVADLVRQLDDAAQQTDVRLTAVGLASGAPAAASADLPPGASAPGPGLPPGVPFTLVYGGGAFGLTSLVDRLQRAVVAGPEGGVEVRGRLVSIDAIELELYEEDDPSAGVRAELAATAHLAPAEGGR